MPSFFRMSQLWHFFSLLSLLWISMTFLNPIFKYTFTLVDMLKDTLTNRINCVYYLLSKSLHVYTYIPSSTNQYSVQTNNLDILIFLKVHFSLLHSFIILTLIHCNFDLNKYWIGGWLIYFVFLTKYFYHCDFLSCLKSFSWIAFVTLRNKKCINITYNKTIALYERYHYVFIMIYFTIKLR